MTEEKSTPIELMFEKMLGKIQKMKRPLIAAFISGFAAYMFCFTNHFEIMDDLCNLFSTGSGLSSGRWGLEIVDAFFPPVSIPWLNGILSLVLLAVLSCIVIEMFSITRPLVQIALAAVLVTFPSQTCTFAYMFISAWYALSLLLSVLCAYLLSHARKFVDYILPVLLLIVSLSIYQAYLAVTVSFLIVFAFKLTLAPENEAKLILRKGLFWITAIVAAVAVYYGINAAAMRLTGMSYNTYAQSNLSGGSLLFNVRVAYTSFAGYFLKGYFDVVSSGFSLAMHALLCLCSAVIAIMYFRSSEKAGGRIAVALLCLVLLPLGVNCLRLVSSLFHNLMLFGFTSVYSLTAVLVENCSDSLKRKVSFWGRDVVALCMAAVACVNIAYANRVYLKMYMQFEQAHSFYSAVIACLNQQPEFTNDSPIAFVGSGEAIYAIPAIDTDRLAGIQLGIIGTYSQAEFIKYYCGMELNVADWDATDNLSADERVIRMPSFPSYGSIQIIDDFFVVKID